MVCQQAHARVLEPHELLLYLLQITLQSPTVHCGRDAARDQQQERDHESDGGGSYYDPCQAYCARPIYEIELHSVMVERQEEQHDEAENGDRDV
jgi:hypothetical protein